jgi:hypothetical protein
MSGLSLSHYIFHLTSTTTFDDKCPDYHIITYIWNLPPRLMTYVWIIIITLYLTYDIYFHFWRHMSGLSHYNSHMKSATTFDDIYQDYLYHSIIYIWHLLSHLSTYVWIIFITLYLTSDIYNHVWRHMTGLSLSLYSLHLTSTTTFDDICVDYLYHTMNYTLLLPPRLMTYVWIIFITLWITP